MSKQGVLPLGERPRLVATRGTGRSLQLETDKVLRARSPRAEPGMIDILRRTDFHILTRRVRHGFWDGMFSVGVRAWVCACVRVLIKK